MLQKQTLGFIGAGNMAGALLKGLTQSGTFRPESIYIFDMNPLATRKAVEAFGVKQCTGNQDVVTKSGAFILAVKPQNIREVLEEIRPSIRDGQLVISIAAGIPLNVIRNTLQKDLPMIRVMPNTPALVQMGVSALSGSPDAGPHHLDLAERIFSAVGDTVIIPEELMDAVTAVSGSGPGYVFRIMEAMVAGGIAVGLSREDALALVLQTFAGAAHLAKTSREPLDRLREMVTSPGGTTAAGLSVLDEHGIESIIVEAIQAARNRARELGKG